MLKNHAISYYHIKLSQVTELKKKLDVQSQLSTRRQKGDGASKQTDFEIMNLKAQKVKYFCILCYSCLCETLLFFFLPTSIVN